MKGNIIVNLDLESLLKLCDKDPKFEVAIQQAALNYLRNNRLKPIMKEEIVREIEQFKKDISKILPDVLKDAGIVEVKANWTTVIQLNDKIRKQIKDTVEFRIRDIIDSTVKTYLLEVYNKVKKDTEIWKTSIKSMIETNITEKTIKEIATEVINKKFK